jgi:hypothetical protein
MHVLLNHRYVNRDYSDKHRHLDILYDVEPIRIRVLMQTAL